MNAVRDFFSLMLEVQTNVSRIFYNAYFIWISAFLSLHTTVASLPFLLKGEFLPESATGSVVFLSFFLFDRRLHSARFTDDRACNKSTADEPRVTHPVCQRMALWPRLPLHWRWKKGSSEIFLLSKAFDYSALRVCVSGEGKSRHIPKGQAGQIPQEENVETKAETWELRNPPCSSRCTQR